MSNNVNNVNTSASSGNAWMSTTSSAGQHSITQHATGGNSNTIVIPPSVTCPYCLQYYLVGQIHICAHMFPTTPYTVSGHPAPEPITEPEVEVVLRYDKRVKCPKCESENDRLSLHYCAGKSLAACVTKCGRRDHIHLTCGRCNYQWLRLSSDAPELDDEGND